MRIRIDKIVFRDQSRMIVGKDDDQKREHEESEEEEPGTGSAGARDRAPTVDLEVVNDQSKPEKNEDEEYTPSCFLLEGRVVPVELCNDRATKIFRLLRNAQILNDDFKPVNKMPWWKRGELADILATELNIQHTWKVFGVFWDMDAESLRGGFNKAKDHALKFDFDEKIMDILR